MNFISSKVARCFCLLVYGNSLDETFFRTVFLKPSKILSNFLRCRSKPETTIWINILIRKKSNERDKKKVLNPKTEGQRRLNFYKIVSM